MAPTWATRENLADSVSSWHERYCPMDRVVDVFRHLRRMGHIWRQARLGQLITADWVFDDPTLSPLIYKKLIGLSETSPTAPLTCHRMPRHRPERSAPMNRHPLCDGMNRIVVTTCLSSCSSDGSESADRNKTPRCPAYGAITVVPAGRRNWKPNELRGVRRSAKRTSANRTCKREIPTQSGHFTNRTNCAWLV